MSKENNSLKQHIHYHNRQIKNGNRYEKEISQQFLSYTKFHQQKQDTIILFCVNT